MFCKALRDLVNEVVYPEPVEEELRYGNIKGMFTYQTWHRIKFNLLISTQN